ncbi:MAG: PAS domain S-box protein [Desulfobacterium sp.]|nr:PAS domain S-box protein [Desulfobacterium sp.]MBU3949017.1 PAS domain S-box protein [Pseudomonadota bacterium]MBU4009303.1 PAS domain S-box protein [Pseudomonadota bacterium]
MTTKGLMRKKEILINSLINDRIKYLRENTDFVSAVFDSLIGYAIIASDFDGNIIAYNEGAHHIYGYVPDEVIGRKNIEVFFPVEFIAQGRFQMVVSELLEKGRVACEAEKVRKDGSIFPARILFTLTTDKNGRNVGFVEIAEDLTERKLAEELTQQARENAARVERLETELRSLADLSSPPPTGVTARMYGVVSLQGGFPDTFRKLTENYAELIDLALEQQAYKVDHDISGRLGAMAETLGFYRAGPRDVVDIHTTALKKKSRAAATIEKKKAYSGEGWIMVLELMGYLVSFYRNRAQGTVTLPNQQTESKNKTVDTKEEENE